MKRFISSLILASLALSSFAIEATVVSVSGKAEIQSGNEWVELKVGDNLKAGSVVQTGFKSNVVLNIKSPNENSTITIAPLSRMTIEKLSEKGGQDNASIYLASGSLKSNIKKTEDRRVGYQVRTPVATASVRGTEFNITNQFRSVAINTTEGSVACWKEAVSAPEISNEEYAENTGETELTGIDSESGVSDETTPNITEREKTTVVATVEKTSTVATSAREISRGAAPKSSFTVAAGQNASLLTNGANATPQATFTRTNLALTNTTTPNAALEAIAPTESHSTGLATSDSTPATPAATTGSLSITVGW